MLVKINDREIETNEICELRIARGVGGSTENEYFYVIVGTIKRNFDFKIAFSNLDIDKEILNDYIELDKYVKEFKTRLFRDLTELLFSDDPFLDNKIDLQARAEFINEMIHNAL